MKEAEQTKIIRGYYLTALGQEPLAYYFKIHGEHPTFTTIEAGDIALSFYQNGETITSIPALIRIDGVIESPSMVEDFLQGEKKDHYPILPIVSVYDQFDPLQFNQMMGTFEQLRSEIKKLAHVKYIQGDLFEFLEEGEFQ